MKLVHGFVFLFLLSSLTLAAVPQQISYQGYLMSSDSLALDTTLTMTFKIYNDSVAGSAAWTEGPRSVTVSAGLFHVLLGQFTPLDEDVFNNPPTWLGVTVGSNSEMTPRTRMVSVPYAYYVGTVDRATGGTISGNTNITGKANIGGGNTNTGGSAFVAGQFDAEMVELLVPVRFYFHVEVHAHANLALVALERIDLVFILDDGRDDKPLAVELIDQGEVPARLRPVAQYADLGVELLLLPQALHQPKLVGGRCLQVGPFRQERHDELAVLVHLHRIVVER